MIDWPIALVEDIAARRSVIFLGAGVSKNATNNCGERPKDWGEFLVALAACIPDATLRTEVEACVAESDLLSACELARHYLKFDVYKTKLLEEFSDKKFLPAKIHDDLIAVDSRFVLTTNFDKLYENRANQIQQNTVIVKNYYDADVADVLRRSQRVVLKIHGSIDTPTQMIFARSDYAAARQRHAHFYRLLGALFLTHTFVFVGTSLRDPDLQMLLEDNRYRFDGSRPHFIVMPAETGRTGVLNMMEETMNLRALQYDRTNHHAELAASIAALVPLVEIERERLIRTMDW